MFCENCGIELEDNDKFCFECGYPAEEDKEYELFKAAKEQAVKVAKEEKQTEKVLAEEIKIEMSRPSRVEFEPKSTSRDRTAQSDNSMNSGHDIKPDSPERPVYSEVSDPIMPGGVKVEEAAAAQADTDKSEKPKKKTSKGFVIAMVVIGVVILAAAFVYFNAINVAGGLLNF